MFSGIEVKFKNMLYPVILAPAFIPELNTVTHTDNGEYSQYYEYFKVNIQ